MCCCNSALFVGRTTTVITQWKQSTNYNKAHNLTRILSGSKEGNKQSKNPEENRVVSFVLCCQNNNKTWHKKGRVTYHEQSTNNKTNTTTATTKDYTKCTTKKGYQKRLSTMLVSCAVRHHGARRKQQETGARHDGCPTQRAVHFVPTKADEWSNLKRCGLVCYHGIVFVDLQIHARRMLGNN